MSPPKGYLPAWTDREVIVKALTLATLTPEMQLITRVAFERIEMEGCRAPKGLRDLLMGVLRDQGLLPKPTVKKNKRGALHFEDPYSEMVTKGTEAAVALLAKPLPKAPPGRKVG